MKYFITLVIILTITQFIYGDVNLEEEDDGALDLIEDDADPNAGYDSDDEQPKPIYKLEDAPKLFKQFIKDYDKKYKNEEDKSKHYKTFVNTLKEINMLNSNKEYSSTVDINIFADLSPEERQQYFGIPGLLDRYNGMVGLCFGDKTLLMSSGSSIKPRVMYKTPIRR